MTKVSEVGMTFRPPLPSDPRLLEAAAEWQEGSARHFDQIGDHEQAERHRAIAQEYRAALAARVRSRQEG